MKKLLSKIEHPPPTGNHSQSSCIGRTWQLTRFTVTVEEIIAEGGFGIVFLARQGSAKYALKRIIVNNEQDLAVASREIQIMTSLGEHPNLLSCLDHVINPLGGGLTETLCLMPFCKGSLLSLLNAKMSAKSHLSENQVLSIFADIVSGTARLHQCATPIIHRDLKIENVLEDESGSWILCDFGSATPKFWNPSVHGIQAVQEDLEKYTTLAYRSPEMVDLYSNRGAITTKSDIWALGILLYKICYYTTPFGESILAIQSANVNFPTSNNPFSTSLQALIQWLLSPETNERPDIYQVAEIVFTSFLGAQNPLTNVNSSPPPPTIESLIASMTQMANTLKAKAEEKPIKSVTPTPMPAETSVTPRQRPKGSIVLPATTNATGILIAPPKSPLPKPAGELVPPPPRHQHQPSSNSSSGSSSASNNNTILAATAAAAAAINNNNNSNNQPASSTIVLPPPNEISNHRRNVSDSSAFEKGLSLPAAEISTCCSASTEAISSWNPFSDDTATESFPSTEISTNDSTKLNAKGIEKGENEDDVFSNAPFDHFKYRPMVQGIDSLDKFGQNPFSNPFLEFSTPPVEVFFEGETNFSFEDEITLK